MEIHKSGKERMETIHENKKEKRDKTFDEVKDCSMINLSGLKSKAFKIVQEEYLLGIKKLLDYIWNICQSKM